MLSQLNAMTKIGFIQISQTDFFESYEHLRKDRHRHLFKCVNLTFSDISMDPIKARAAFIVTIRERYRSINIQGVGISLGVLDSICFYVFFSDVCGVCGVHSLDLYSVTPHIILVY